MKACVRSTTSLHSLNVGSEWQHNLDPWRFPHVFLVHSAADDRYLFPGDKPHRRPAPPSLLKSKFPLPLSDARERERKELLRHLSGRFRGKKRLDGETATTSSSILCLLRRRSRSLLLVILTDFFYQADVVVSACLSVSPSPPV